MAEKGEQQKEFELTLSQLSGNVRDIYDRLLITEQARLTVEKKTYVAISLDDKEKILSRARQIAQYGKANPKKMAEDWKFYDKRPPIGGSKGN